MAKVSMILSFKNEGLTENLAYFVAAEPIPMDVDGKPLYTPMEWVKQYSIRNLKYAMQKGKDKISAAKIDDDVIT